MLNFEICTKSEGHKEEKSLEDKTSWGFSQPFRFGILRVKQWKAL